MVDATNTPNSPGKQEKNRTLGLALLLALAVSIAFQGSRGLYETTEGRYVLCARQTLDSGQLLEPMLNGQHHWTKPPLTYTAIAAGLACFGDNAWGARAYLAVAFVAAVAGVYWAGRAMWNTRAGALAALVYATAPFTIGAANAVSTDTLLTCFLAWGTAFFWLALDQNRKGFMVAMWAALGLAALTKGPMAFLPLAGMLPAYWQAKRAGRAVPFLFPITGLLLFTVIGLGWYVLEIYRHPYLLDYWFMHETVGRFAENEFQRNPELMKIFTIYPPVLLLGTGPWLLLYLWKESKLPMGERFSAWRSVPRTPQGWYLLCAILFPFAAFSLVTSKLALYVLPLFVPMALGLGFWLDLLLETGRVRLKTLLGTACAIALLAIVGKGVWPYVPNRNDMAQLSAQLRPLLAAHPGKSLVLCAKEPMNGLEFYLKREVPCVDLSSTQVDQSPQGPAKETVLTADRLSVDTLVLARVKVLKMLQTVPGLDCFEVLLKDRHYSVARVTRPITTEELRAKIALMKAQEQTSGQKGKR